MAVEVVAALIWDQDKFMICQRPSNKARGLLWEFVGGKVEPRETKEQALIRERMAEAGISNMGAYMRKMALNGYVLHVDLSDIRELVSLQRGCDNNLNQAAIHVNTYGGIYPDEIKALQRDYADLWRPLADLLKKLAAVVEM